MKRSEINRALREMEAIIREYKIALPPFCDFTPCEWQDIGHEYDEVRDNMLGWDITDFGSGNFDEVGLSLITLRNGNAKMREKYPKTYAEKLLYIKDGQLLPNHFHWDKMEDIINRGGGNLLVRVHNALENEAVDRTGDVTLRMDGCLRTVPAGFVLRLEPGMSITIHRRLYHDFIPERGTGAVLLGEVSACNDDHADNRFEGAVGRFPAIEEDEAPYRLLVGEYPAAK